MTTKTSGNWLVDLNNMTCLNTENRIVIAFVKKGPMLVGKIKKIPIELIEKWIADPDRERKLKKAVIEADEVFFKAYFAKEIEGKPNGVQPSHAIA